MGDPIDLHSWYKSQDIAGQKRNALLDLPEMGPEYAEDGNTPWTAEDYERRYQAMHARLTIAMEALRAWEAWEAAWLKDDPSWTQPDGVIRLPQARYDEMVGLLQPLRNRALYMTNAD